MADAAIYTLLYRRIPWKIKKGDNMKTAGIIAEFNPFHNGHQYLIDQSRNVYGAERIVVIMSGDFVQRGAPACFDKYTRCRMALECGADLVLELPCLGSLASAEGFAASAVSILDSLGIVDMLCFGCEDADPGRFQAIVSILNEEPDIYRDALQEALRSGKNYPAARELALSKCLPDSSDTSAILEMIRKPNNILAIEYFRALAKAGSSIRPIPIRRIGNGYLDESANGEYVSASAIRMTAAPYQSDKRFADMSLFAGSGQMTGQRNAVSSAKSEGLSSGHYYEEFEGFLKRTMPPAASSVFIDGLRSGGILDLNDFSNLFFYVLLKEKGNLDAFADISPQLAERLEDASIRTNSLENLIEAVSARSYTQARIRRCLLHILLNHTKDLISAWKNEGYTGYVNVLGFRRGFEDDFSSIPKTIRQSMILRSAERRTLTGTASMVSSSDLFASELYRSVYTGKYGGARRPILSEPLIVKQTK